MIDSDISGNFPILFLRVARTCRWLGVDRGFVAEHLVGMTSVSGILIAIVTDELGDELSCFVNALWDLFVDPTVAG